MPNGDNPRDPELLTPTARRAAWRSIPPTRDCARTQRQLLLRILVEEMRYRAEDEEPEYYENLYWCQFLIYLAGDPSDVQILWQWKHVNMDTTAGTHEQCLVGAGLDATLQFLQGKADCEEILSHILWEQQFSDWRDLSKWEREAAEYYYALEP